MARRPTPGTTSPSPAASAARLTGVVLLVEDEPAVRTVMRRIMEMRGLTVLLAERSDEALAVSAGYPGRIDVLLTDVQLPGMDGPELAERLRAARPELKIVFISGYPREEAFAHATDDASAEFLQKPFTPAQLAEVLGRVLDSAAAITPPPAKLEDAHEMPATDSDTSVKPEP